jgi:hypothetical protein
METEQKLQRIEKKVEENSAAIKANGAGIKANSAAIKANSAGIKANGVRLTRVEAKVDENRVAIEKNGERLGRLEQGHAELLVGQDNLREGQAKQQKQIDDHFEFFRVYFDRQQEENRRHIEVLIEQFQSGLAGSMRGCDG